MIYTKKFNEWFDKFDTGMTTDEQLENIKRDMSSAWDYQQEEIDRLRTQIEKMKDCANCKHGERGYEGYECTHKRIDKTKYNEFCNRYIDTKSGDWWEMEE
jgi:hypothetical protein